MSITLLGAACLLAALYGFLVRPHILLYLCVFFIPFSGSAVINVHSVTFGLPPSFFFMIAMTASAMMRGGSFVSTRMSRDSILVVLGVLAFYLCIQFSNFIAVAERRFAFFQFTQTVFVSFALLSLVSFYSVLSFRQREATLAWLGRGMLFTALWGLVQIVCFYSGIPYPSFLFNNSVSDYAYMFDQRAGNIVRMASVTLEPSLFSFTLVQYVAFLGTRIVYGDETVSRFERRLLALLVVVLLISTSTTGYLALAFLVLLWSARRPIPVLAAGLAGSALMAGALAMLPEFRATLYDFTFGKIDSFSFNERFGTIVDAVEAFRERPIFGWGWGKSTAFSFAPMLLACVGIVGTALFCLVALATLWIARYEPGARGAEATARIRLRAAGMALTLSLFMSLTSGLKYNTLDTWFWWAFVLVAHSDVVRVARSPSRLTRGARPDGEPVHAV